MGELVLFDQSTVGRLDPRTQVILLELILSIVNLGCPALHFQLVANLLPPTQLDQSPQARNRI
jgi:hypothetical protein